MASWKDVLMDVLTLTEAVKQLDASTEKLSERTIDIDRRLVRLETMVEIAQQNRLSDSTD